jgi:hypothetical protein
MGLLTTLHASTILQGTVIEVIRFSGALLAVYGAASIAIWVGATHTYYAWTGQRDKLSVVVAGPSFIREGPAFREVLWKFGGPFCVLSGILIIAYLTNFAILCPLSARFEFVPAIYCDGYPDIT